MIDAILRSASIRGTVCSTTARQGFAEPLRALDAIQTVLTHRPVTSRSDSAKGAMAS